MVYANALTLDACFEDSLAEGYILEPEKINGIAHPILAAARKPVVKCLLIEINLLRNSIRPAIAHVLPHELPQRSSGGPQARAVCRYLCDIGPRDFSPGVWAGATNPKEIADEMVP